MSNIKKNNQGERLTVRATLVTIGISVFFGVLTIGNTQTSQQLDKVTKEYSELEEQYKNLNEKYNELTSQVYWQEYFIEQGETIIDKGTGCSIIVGPVFLSNAKVIVSNETGTLIDKYMDEGDQIDIFGDGQYVICLQTIDNTNCKIVIKEN